MALDPLATAADLTARGITVQPAEETAVGVWLDTASAAVRDAAGSPISQVTSTITIPGTRDTHLRLPAPPVTAVTTVVLDGRTLDPADYTLTADDLWRWRGWQDRWPCDRPSEVTVTYTHGLPIVPADVVDLVCALVTAALVASRADPDGTGLAASPGVTQERIDDYSVSFDATETGTTVFELSDRLRARLRARFGGGASMVRAR